MILEHVEANRENHAFRTVQYPLFLLIVDVQYVDAKRTLQWPMLMFTRLFNFKYIVVVPEIQQWTTATILQETTNTLKSKSLDSSTTMTRCTSTASYWLVIDTRLTPGE